MDYGIAIRNKLIGAAIVLFLLLLIGIGVLWLSFTENAQCQEFPTMTAAQEAMSLHQDFVRQIKNSAPEYIDVWASEIDGCPGKGQIFILYTTKNGSDSIQNLLDDDFFGIPYTLLNG